MTSTHPLRIATFLSLMAASGLASASPSGGWDWFIAPYGWFIGVDADIQSTTPRQ